MTVMAGVDGLPGSDPAMRLALRLAPSPVLVVPAGI
jgi:hypothetical protein